MRDRVALRGLVPQLLLDGPVDIRPAGRKASAARRGRAGCRTCLADAAGAGASPPMKTSRASDALCQGRCAPLVASDTRRGPGQRALDFEAGVVEMLGERRGVGAVLVLAVIGDGAGIGRVGDQQAAGIVAQPVRLHRSEAGATTSSGSTAAPRPACAPADCRGRRRG